LPQTDYYFFNISPAPDVRFTPKSGHVQCTSQCPLCAIGGHYRVYEQPD
jgi:hypothetical protein